jgi:hypothetical protein
MADSNNLLARQFDQEQDRHVCDALLSAVRSNFTRRPGTRSGSSPWTDSRRRCGPRAGPDRQHRRQGQVPCPQPVT